MNTNVSLLLVDRQNSVTAAVSHNARSYTVYGALDRIDDLFTGFTGENRDQVTGCYHLGLGYRTYNPVLMRFHSADSLSPFGQGGINTYAYRDPLNFRDPSGHSPIAVSAGAQRVMTATFGGFSLGKSMLSKPPTTPLEKLIFRLAVSGGMLAIGGATAQVAGWTAAAYMSNAGTAAAGVAHVLGFGKSLYDGRHKLVSNMTGNLRILIGMEATVTRPSTLGGLENHHSSAPPQSPLPSPTPTAPPLTPGPFPDVPSHTIEQPRHKPYASIELLEGDESYFGEMNRRTAIRMQT